MKLKFEDVMWPKTLFDDTEPRQVGIHLSDVAHYIATVMKTDYKPGDGFKDMELTAEIGLLWECVLSRIMRDKYAFRPPQVQRDGIWMSLDGIAPPNPFEVVWTLSGDPIGEVPLVVEEYKCTWRSSNKTPDTNFVYMTQIKSYCHVMETTTAIMRIFYLMGNYKGSGPVYRIARFTFTPWELEQNWKMVVKYKDEAVAKGVLHEY